MAQVARGLDMVAAGLTVQQAAVAYGVSERTVRRRIKEGTLAAEKVPTAQGYEWRVQLDGAACPPGGQACRVDGDRVDGRAVSTVGRVDSVADEVGEALVRALALVEWLQRENLELAGRVGFLQGKLQETQAQLLALAPPAVAPLAPVTLGVAESPASGGASPGRWRRLWRVLGGVAGA